LKPNCFGGIMPPPKHSAILFAMPLQMRSSQALQLWRAVTERGVRSDAPDLTQRQLAILMIVYLEPPPHTVRGLAARLQVTKPVISRALDTMGAASLVERQVDPADRRSILIRRTLEGAAFLETLAGNIIEESKGLPL
jgi:DNA-binding MarR family transcriptional regulator